MRPGVAGDVSADMRTPRPEGQTAHSWPTCEQAIPFSWQSMPTTGASPPGSVRVGEEFQGGGVDDLRSFDEAQMPGMGKLQGVAPRARVGDLLAELHGKHHVVLEADDERGRRNTS